MAQIPYVMPEKKKIIACKNCKFFQDFCPRCAIPNGYKLDPYHGFIRNYTIHHQSDPSYPNKNNNCERFKRKWWKFWIK